MATYNRITPEIAAQLRAVVGNRFYEQGGVDPNYSHDEMPIYGKYMPDAAESVESTEEVSGCCRPWRPTRWSTGSCTRPIRARRPARWAAT